MIQIRQQICFFILTLGLLIAVGCGQHMPGNIQEIKREPDIYPEYSGVTIPPNIAPLNFLIKENGNFFQVKITSSLSDMQFSIKSSDNVIHFSEKKWGKLLKGSIGGEIKIHVYSSGSNDKVFKKYQPVSIFVAKEKIDPYLCYRLLYPGYYSWVEMKIMQRSLEGFREESLIENQIIEYNCVNCHSFNKKKSDKFLVHIRGSKGGTYFVERGEITRTSLKIENMPGGATYPSWHPGGRYVAFSSNNVSQSFYAHPQKSIEVYDHISTLVLYDIENNEMLYLKEPDSLNYLQTFPEWSPDGKYLYYCRAKKPESSLNFENIKHIHYDLARKAFNPESRSFGKAEIIFDASKREKSVSFPKISPDGKYLVFTLHDYGTFPIWHKEADLYLLNLQNGEYMRMNLNSDETESYHSWSSNGKWLVFSSKREDGRSARPYFAYFVSPYNIGKPFVMPQKDPNQYHEMLKTFNIPEFIVDKVKATPRDFARASNKKSLQAISGNPEDTPAKLIRDTLKNPSDDIKWEIHE
jgi:WD40 repeat protein